MRFVTSLSAPLLAVSSLTAVAVTAIVAACSSAVEPTTLTDAGGPGAGEGGPQLGASETLQTGRAAVVQTNKPIEGATIRVAGKQATSGADGRYSLIVPRGLPITLKLSAPDHYQLIEQEYVIDQPTYERGDSLTLRNQTAMLLAAFLSDLDKSKGLVAVSVIPLKGCPTEGGTVLTMASPSGASLRYTQGGVPDSNNYLTEGDTNGALFYNVLPGPVTITAESPHCVMAPFPVKADGVTYTGALTTEAGESFSFMRIFLAPKPKSDAGVSDAAGGDANSDAAIGDAATD